MKGPAERRPLLPRYFLGPLTMMSVQTSPAAGLRRQSGPQERRRINGTCDSSVNSGVLRFRFVRYWFATDAHLQPVRIQGSEDVLAVADGLAFVRARP